MFENVFSFNILEFHFLLFGLCGYYYSNFFWKNISVKQSGVCMIPAHSLLFGLDEVFSVVKVDQGMFGVSM